MRKRPDAPLIFKNITLKIKPGEKIGVCGRTGSGKSTLLLCLFLISEGYEGKILIDDIYINKIELEMLRNSLTIILQEPILIEGNIRDNIDPSKELNDIKIIKLSNKVGLSNFIGI